MSEAESNGDDSQRPSPISCWRVYPEESGLFADESLQPNDDSILIRQDEETDEYLKGYVTHPEHGMGLLEATFQKDKLVGWREEVVVPSRPRSRLEKLLCFARDVFGR